MSLLLSIQYVLLLHIEWYPAHFSDDRSLSNIADVYDGLKATTDGLVVIENADVSFKLKASFRLQFSTHQHHSLHTAARLLCVLCVSVMRQQLERQPSLPCPFLPLSIPLPAP